MTNEEAKEILTNLKGYNKVGWLAIIGDRREEALDTAIKALEGEVTTVNELRALADKMGYYITRRRGGSNKGFKCKDCKFLDLNEASTIGYACINPNRTFRTLTARYKYRYTPACRLFVQKEK